METRKTTSFLLQNSENNNSQIRSINNAAKEKDVLSIEPSEIWFKDVVPNK
jgi:hypothetical protein